MRSLMVAGTSSWAGKSPITTGLCASLRRRGVRVTPFKAQNMSDNARVVYGGEIGTAQYLQALAAGVAPPVDHNPVLVKPESDTSGQVVVDGAVDRGFSRTPWRERAPVLWGSMGAAFDRGGAFAHLYGTWALLGQDDRRRIRGFVLNKFRGDPALLDPGPSSWRR